MKKIEFIKYEAPDGKRFDTEDACLEHEAVLNDIIYLERLLDTRPEGVDFVNGSYYIQHNVNRFNSVKALALNLVLRHVPNSGYAADSKYAAVKNAINVLDIDYPDHDPEQMFAFVGKLRNCGIPAPIINFLTDRFCTTDSNFREWGQPFYALNPDEGTQLCLKGET